MFFSMIRPRKNVSSRDIAAMTKGDGYQVHRLVWGLFADSPDRQRDFLYRNEEVNNLPTIYAVSQREPLDTSKLWEVHPKEYSPKLTAGQKLAFTLRANPIRSRRDENGKQHRHDIIMEAKIKMEKDENNSPLAEIVQLEGSRWLLEKGNPLGFEVSDGSIRVDGYRQHKLSKGIGNKPVAFSTLDFNGTLTVTDPVIFIEKCLFTGLGPAKAFGCGLMLVRRV